MMSEWSRVLLLNALYMYTTSFTVNFELILFPFLIILIAYVPPNISVQVPLTYIYYSLSQLNRKSLCSPAILLDSPLTLPIAQWS